MNKLGFGEKSAPCVFGLWLHLLYAFIVEALAYTAKVADFGGRRHSVFLKCGMLLLLFLLRLRFFIGYYVDLILSFSSALKPGFGAQN
jgi:hypothetical protein